MEQGAEGSFHAVGPVGWHCMKGSHRPGAGVDDDPTRRLLAWPSGVWLLATGSLSAGLSARSRPGSPSRGQQQPGGRIGARLRQVPVGWAAHRAYRAVARCPSTSIWPPVLAAARRCASRRSAGRDRRAAGFEQLVAKRDDDAVVAQVAHRERSAGLRSSAPERSRSGTLAGRLGGPLRLRPSARMVDSVSPTGG